MGSDIAWVSIKCAIKCLIAYLVTMGSDAAWVSIKCGVKCLIVRLGYYRGCSDSWIFKFSSIVEAAGPIKLSTTGSAGTSKCVSIVKLAGPSLLVALVFAELTLTANQILVGALISTALSLATDQILLKHHKFSCVDQIDHCVHEGWSQSLSQKRRTLTDLPSFLFCKSLW